jgi:hypothetical protein
MLFSARFGHLLHLLSKHRHLRLSRFPRLASMLMLCGMLQRYIKREDRLYDSTVRDIIPDAPLFIVGHWRSGTTYLHSLISLDIEHFSYPTTYQCFFPTVFLHFHEQTFSYWFLNRLMGTRQRLIDNITISLSSPQEEEWMYLPEGGYSFIAEKLIFPQTAKSNMEDVLKISADNMNRQVSERIFKKFAYAYHQRIVSKSPGHFSRISMLKELFPKSQFIFLVRNPYDVIISAINARRILTKIFSLQGEHMDDCRTMATFLLLYVKTIHASIESLGQEQYIFMQYEDLIRDPIEHLKMVYEKFDMTYSQEFDDRLKIYLHTIKDYKKNQFAITPEMKEIIYDECRGIFDAYSYAR